MNDLKFSELHEANKTRSSEWNVPNDGAAFRTIELAGEVGEACDVVKKLLRDGAPGALSASEGIRKLADELADVVICADRLAEHYHIDLGRAVRDKFNRTSEKHGFQTMLKAREE